MIYGTLSFGTRYLEDSMCFMNRVEGRFYLYVRETNHRETLVGKINEIN